MHQQVDDHEYGNGRKKIEQQQQRRHGPAQIGPGQPGEQEHRHHQLEGNDTEGSAAVRGKDSSGSHEPAQQNQSEDGNQRIEYSHTALLFSDELRSRQQVYWPNPLSRSEFLTDSYIYSCHLQMTLNASFNGKGHPWPPSSTCSTPSSRITSSSMACSRSGSSLPCAWP